MNPTTFLAWDDHDRKRKPIDKLGEAVDRYIFKFNQRPNVCIVNPANLDALAGRTDLTVRTLHAVGPDSFYVGCE